MIRKLLCFLGFHKWKIKDAWLIKDNIKYTRKCKHCGKLKRQSGLSAYLEQLVRK